MRLAVPGVEREDVREQAPGPGRRGEQPLRCGVARPVQPGHAPAGPPRAWGRRGQPRRPARTAASAIRSSASVRRHGRRPRAGPGARHPGPHQRRLGAGLLGQPALGQVGVGRHGRQYQGPVGPQLEILPGFLPAPRARSSTVRPGHPHTRAPAPGHRPPDPHVLPLERAGRHGPLPVTKASSPTPDSGCAEFSRIPATGQVTAGHTLLTLNSLRKQVAWNIWFRTF